MKVIKKNQLAILVISLMLITAGYLNYDSNYNNNIAMDTSTELEESVNLAALGDAELVNTNVTEENKEEQANTTLQEEKSQEEQQKEQQIPNNEKANISTGNNNYFTTSKLERNVMYSQMIERYKEIIVNNTQAPEQKTIAQEEINKINGLQNAIMISENLLTSKGFEQNIIFVNGDSISVIIGRDKLETDEIAQIQNIVSRELSANVENIHISMK